MLKAMRIRAFHSKRNKKRIKNVKYKKAWAQTQHGPHPKAVSHILAELALIILQLAGGLRTADVQNKFPQSEPLASLAFIAVLTHWLWSLGPVIARRLSENTAE